MRISDSSNSRSRLTANSGRLLRPFVRSQRVKKKKGKVCVRARRPIKPALNSGFCSMKASDWEYCYSPLDGMLVHRKVTPQHSVWSPVPIYTPGWRETMRNKVSCPPVISVLLSHLNETKLILQRESFQVETDSLFLHLFWTWAVLQQGPCATSDGLLSSATRKTYFYINLKCWAPQISWLGAFGLVVFLRKQPWHRI